MEPQAQITRRLFSYLLGEFLAKSTTEQAAQSLSTSVSSASSVYHVEDYGILPNGEDIAEPLLTLISTVNDAGGGTIVFPAGTYVLRSNLVLPNSGDGVPRQSPLHIVGAGHHEDGRWGNDQPNQGTIILFFGFDGIAHIDTRGTGVLVMEDLTLQVGINTQLPLIHTTNTTLKIHRCCLWGHYQCKAANIDGVVLGGSTTNIDGSATAAFQGYGTVIENNFFQNIRRAVYGRIYANGVVVRDNTIGSGCGNSLEAGACIELDGNAAGAVSGQLCTGWTIQGNTIEAPHYVYPIKLTSASWNVIMGNGTYDDTEMTIASVYITDVHSYGNVIIGSQPLTRSKPYLVDQSGQSSNLFLSPVVGGIAGAYSKLGAVQLQTPSAAFPHLINDVRFTGQTVVQPSYSYGGANGAKVFQIIRSATDSRNPGAEVFSFDISGGLHINDVNAGNITNSMPTGASWSSNGRAWVCNGTGSAMTQYSGSGGSYFYMRNYAAIFTRWDNNQQVAKIGPVYGDNGAEGIGLGTAADAGIYRGSSGQTVVMSPLQTPRYTVDTLPEPTPALMGARAHVIDADAPAFLRPVLGGGRSVCPVFCNGTEWVAA